MPDPVLDASTPCCTDLSKVAKSLKDFCATSPKLGPGGTGGTGRPATGTWSNSLNATGGGSGGGGGASWSAPDPEIAEGWT